MFKRYQQYIPAILAAAIILGCGGGGGGGGGTEGPAKLRVEAHPEAIDSGDRMDVVVKVLNFNENTIALKVRFPVGLTYINKSSYLDIGGTLEAVTPTSNASDSEDNYLVYYFNRTKLGLDQGGTMDLLLELKGVSNIPSGYLAADADIDDPRISNATEFSADDPQFDALDDEDIRVGPAPTGTPTS